MSLRIPRTFVLYLFRFLFTQVSLTFLGVLGIFILLDLVDNLRAYTRHGAGGKAIALLYLYRLPELASQLAPAALILGTLLCLYRFARRRELTAIEVAGISPLWSYGTVLFLGGLFTSTHLILELHSLPRFREKAELFYQREIERKPVRGTPQERTFLYRDELWQLWREEAQGQERLHLRRFAIQGDRFLVESFALSPEGALLEAQGLSFPPREAYLPQATQEDLYEILSLYTSRAPEHLTLREAISTLKKLDKEGLDRFPLWLDLFSRFSWALLNLTALLAILPFLPHHGKRAEAARGVFLALAIAVSGWALITVGAALATSSRNLLGLLLPHGGLLAFAILGRVVGK